MFVVSKKTVLLLICCSFSLESIASDQGPERKGGKKGRKVARQGETTSAPVEELRDAIADTKNKIEGMQGRVDQSGYADREELYSHLTGLEDQLEQIDKNAVKDAQEAVAAAQDKADEADSAVQEAALHDDQYTGHIAQQNAREAALAEQDAQEKLAAAQQQLAQDQAAQNAAGAEPVSSDDTGEVAASLSTDTNAEAVAAAHQSDDLSPAEQAVVVEAVGLLGLNAVEVLSEKQKKAGAIIKRALQKKLAKAKSKKAKQELEAASDVVAAFVDDASNLVSVINKNEDELAVSVDTNAEAVAAAPQSDDLSKTEQAAVVDALDILGLDAAALMDITDMEMAAREIAKKEKKERGAAKSKEQREAVKAAAEVAKAFVRDASNLASVIDANEDKLAVSAVSAKAADVQTGNFLKTEIEIAKNLASQGVTQVTFDGLAKLSHGVQVTPGLMGSVQVCLWNNLNMSQSSSISAASNSVLADSALVQKIVDVVHRLQRQKRYEH